MELVLRRRTGKETVRNKTACLVSLVPFGRADGDEVADVAQGGSPVHGVSSAGRDGLLLSQSGNTT